MPGRSHNIGGIEDYCMKSALPLAWVNGHGAANLFQPYAADGGRFMNMSMQR
jgi:hypothetical protein